MSSLIRGRRNAYGEAIGILVLDTRFPRVPGDIGNATTWEFPVRYHRVFEATSHRVIKEGDSKLLIPFLDGAKELEKAEVRAITTSCGFLAQFQRELASSARVPVFTSSLLLVPMVYRMLKPEQKVGILTADATRLGETHFTGSGWTSKTIPVVVRGLQDYEEFRRVFLENGRVLDTDQVGRAVVDAAKNLVQDRPEVGALVFECTNLAPYASLVQEAVGLPVFDIQLFTNLMFEATHREPYEGEM